MIYISDIGGDVVVVNNFGTTSSYYNFDLTNRDSKDLISVTASNISTSEYYHKFNLSFTYSLPVGQYHLFIKDSDSNIITNEIVQIGTTSSNVYKYDNTNTPTKVYNNQNRI
jgi:hypothetical protein